MASVREIPLGQWLESVPRSGKKFNNTSRKDQKFENRPNIRWHCRRCDMSRKDNHYFARNQTSTRFFVRIDHQEMLDELAAVCGVIADILSDFPSSSLCYRRRQRWVIHTLFQSLPPWPTKVSNQFPTPVSATVADKGEQSIPCSSLCYRGRQRWSINSLLQSLQPWPTKVINQFPAMGRGLWI